MDIWALVLSIVSIVLSIVTFAVEQGNSAKLNKINLQAEYFRNLYADYLFKLIPQARRKICFVNDKLDGYEELQDTLDAVRKDSVYFYYLDNGFFNSLKTACQELEDCLLTTANRTVITVEQAKASDEIDQKITVLYQVVKNKYENG